MILLLLLPLLGCRGAADGADTGPGCDAPGLALVSPASDADQVSRSAPLRLALDGDGPVDSLEVGVWVDGVAMTGALSVTGDLAAWQPDDLLPADAVVEWTASTCAASLSDRYTTGSEGDQIDATSLVGGTWAMDLSTARWVQPPGGELLFGELFQGLLAIGVRDATADSIDVLGGALEITEEGRIQQDPCVASFELLDLPFDNNPYIDAGPTTLDLAVQGIEVPVQQVTISGAFAADGDTLADARLTAEIDARTMEASVGMSAASLCELLELYTGLPCMDCSDDGETLCIGMQVEDITGQRIEGLQMMPNANPQECGGA